MTMNDEIHISTDDDILYVPTGDVAGRQIDYFRVMIRIMVSFGLDVAS